MAQVQLRPNATDISGNFKDESNSTIGGSIFTKINDDNDSTFVYNTSTNQIFVGGIDNTSGLSGATFNNFKVKIKFGRHSPKGGSATCKVDVGNSSSTTAYGSVTDTTFTTTNFTATTITSSIINFASGVSSSDIDDIRIVFTTTNGTQVRLYELTVIVDFTAASSGYGNAVIGVASANIEKVDGVATANIEKVIGV